MSLHHQWPLTTTRTVFTRRIKISFLWLDSDFLHLAYSAFPCLRSTAIPAALGHIHNTLEYRTRRTDTHSLAGPSVLFSPVFNTTCTTLIVSAQIPCSIYPLCLRALGLAFAMISYGFDPGRIRLMPGRKSVVGFSLGRCGDALYDMGCLFESMLSPPFRFELGCDFMYK